MAKVKALAKERKTPKEARGNKGVVLRFPTPEKLLQVLVGRDGKPCGLMVGGKVLPTDLAKDYIGQAKTISELPFFRLLIESLKSESCEHIFNKSKVLDDLTWGKAMLWMATEAERQTGLVSKVEIPVTAVVAKAKA